MSSPGSLPIPGVTPRSPTSHALAGRFFTAEPPPQGLPAPGPDKTVQKPIPPHRNASPTSSKTAKSHFLWTDCTRLFLHFSERASFTPLCSPSTHPPWQHIPLSSPPSAAWTTTTHVHAGRDSLVSDVAQTGASRVEVPATQRRKKETRSGAQRGPGGLESWAWSLHRGLHSWPWGASSTVSMRCLTPLCEVPITNGTEVLTHGRIALHTAHNSPIDTHCDC